MGGVKTSTLIGIVVVLTIVAGLLLSLSHIAKQQRIMGISSYAECAQAGFPVLESYPEQCRTPDGRIFVNTDAPLSMPIVTASSTHEASLNQSTSTLESD